MYSVSEMIFVFGLTCYFLSNLQFESTQYIHVCMTIIMSNFCMWTSTCNYACLLLFSYSRFFHLNSILRQLLFDKPMEDLVFVTKRGMRKPKPSLGLKETDAIPAVRNEECAFSIAWKNFIEMCTKM